MTTPIVHMESESSTNRPDQLIIHVTRGISYEARLFKVNNDGSRHTVSIYETMYLVEYLRHPYVKLTKVLSKEKRPSPKQFNNSENHHENDYEDDDMQLENVQTSFLNDILQVIC